MLDIVEFFRKNPRKLTNPWYLMLLYNIERQHVKYKEVLTGGHARFLESYKFATVLVLGSLHDYSLAVDLDNRYVLVKTVGNDHTVCVIDNVGKTPPIDHLLVFLFKECGPDK